MKNYTRSGYVRSRTTGRLTGYAQSQTDSKDVIVLETSRGTDGHRFRQWLWRPACGHAH